MEPAHEASPTGRMTSRRHNTSDEGLDAKFRDFEYRVSVATAVRLLATLPYASADTLPARPPNDALAYDVIDGRLRPVSTAEKFAKVRKFRECIQELMEEDERSANTTCFNSLGRAINRLDENETETLGARLFFGATLGNRSTVSNASTTFGLLAVIDALGSSRAKTAQKIFYRILTAAEPTVVFVERVLMTLPQLKVPRQDIVEALEAIALDPETVAAPLRTLPLRHHALLVLGVMARRCHTEGQLDAADRITARVEAVLLNHTEAGVPADVTNRGKQHKELETNVVEIEHHHHAAVYLEALGNAGLARSLPILLGHARDQDNHLLLRESGFHALRKYKSFEVEEALIRGALTDPHHVVRSGAKVPWKQPQPQQ